MTKHPRGPRRALWAALSLVLIVAALWAAVWALNVRGESPPADDAAPFVATPQQVERGAYLARAGNCAGCHTARGGAAYAGGLAIETPFGTVFSSNLTPDPATGLGRWSAAHFWRAMHHGRSMDGRLLYPAFPYTDYTLVTREDSDALFAYLRSLPPVAQARPAHALRFPYDTQAALAVWRALYFEPARFEPEADRPAEWNRGAYLVRGLGHCSACHTQRNALGASDLGLPLGGGLIPVQNWYAPSLRSADEAGVAEWSTQDVVDLLKTGRSARGSAMGPMAEVVARSTQHLDDADLNAMAVYLQSLPQHGARRPRTAHADAAAAASPGSRGAKLYEQHCAQCHGPAGEGAAGLYPPLAGNRAVSMDSAANLIRIVQGGGYLPATAGNPRPFGMPPFAHVLDEADTAAVLSYVRGAWGNGAAPVTPLEVLRLRPGALR
ncbi:alcohol dehydrogenase [Methylibium sp. Pch-M]|uniref:c-type cytochrome n=1 Tax=Methylibium sp. Pch-M TaxID=2082386 RepID=UPI0010124584|nr:cytochrome c [Methylibium sp. Pch-M]QAZ40244.1 alcohol dehydrogenase [Methylibium sp. Pch-M]